MIPPSGSAEFVANMEDVLDLYLRPYDPEMPVICVDEMPLGLTEAAREGLPMRRGSPAKEDYEYLRKGAAVVFGALDLKGGRRLFEVSERRAGADFARFIRRVVDELCAGTQRVKLVLDNLSTHTKGAFYRAFGAPEAFRVLSRVELHYTPKHGSWLNAVELEFAACHRQCLKGKRIGALEELCQTIRAWQDARNEQRQRVRWTFDVPSAREKLHHIYPATNEP